MEHVRMTILDIDGEPVGHMDNYSPKGLNYWDETLHTYLSGNAETFEFTVSAYHKDSQLIVEGNKISFRYNGKDYYMNIMTVERDEEKVHAVCYGMSFSFLYSDAGNISKENKSFSWYVQYFSDNSVTIGTNEIESKTLTYNFTSTSTLLSRLFELATLFDAEIAVRVQLNDDGTLFGTWLDVFEKHGNFSGIGTDKSDVVLKYGIELKGIQKTTDISHLYTALDVRGENNLWITSIDGREELDSSGQREFYVDNGIIYAVQAKDKYPSMMFSKQAGGTSHYIKKINTYNIGLANDGKMTQAQKDEDKREKVEQLYQAGLADLKKNCVPQVSFKVQGMTEDFSDGNIGDLYTLSDSSFDPPLYLTARIVEQEIHFSDPTQNKTVFDNFTQVESEISVDLMDQFKRMLEQAKVYDCYLTSSDGVVLKPGQGTTLTAHVMDDGEDIAENFTSVWYRDGKEIDHGKTSLVIPGKDVTEKGNVYRYVALKDDLFTHAALAEATVIQITDGDAAFNVLLSRESYVCSGTVDHVAYDQSFVVNVLTLLGLKKVTGHIGGISCPEGVSMTIRNNDTDDASIEVKVTTELKEPCTITIPVTIQGVVFSKQLSIGIAYAGKDGSDALELVVTSEDGSIFKNVGIDTVLTAHVYRNGLELTGAALNAYGVIKWYPNSSPVAVAKGRTYMVKSETGLTYIARLEA